MLLSIPLPIYYSYPVTPLGAVQSQLMAAWLNKGKEVKISGTVG
jgi:hypothetical protein